MKNLKKVLALVLAVVMVMGAVVTTSAAYKDVKDTDTYANAIDVLSNIGILDGFEDGTFKADGTLTRAQAAKIVAIVHNAKTNGWIDTDIDELYANAQNPFVDCNNSWALPYINYCRITGLADGMTATTYEPNRVLTGVQFLKLMLTTLGFDTAKEGYTGTGWDINVLNRANEVGLTDGLATGWKAIAPLTRGEAAQILYNALTSNLVEYGQKVKNTYDTTDKYYTAAFIANEQVSATGYLLASKMNVGVQNAYDVFMRPGILWSYGKWSAFYADTAVKTYTGKVTACDILVDLGFAKTSNASANVVYFRNGRLDTWGPAAHNHTTNNCLEAVGNTGALTQVYKMLKADGKSYYYFVNVIDTFLAKVTGVSTAKHHTVDVATATLDLYAPDFLNSDLSAKDTNKFSNNEYSIVVPYLTDYANGDYILTHVAMDYSEESVEPWMNNELYGTWSLYAGDTKAYNNATVAVYGVSAYVQGQGTVPVETDLAVVPFQKASTIDSAVFSGQNSDRSVITVNGTQTPVNCTYTLTGIFNGQDEHWALIGKSATNFFVDQYGNVIGDSNVFAANYAIVDAAKWVNDGDLSATEYAQFALVDLDAKMSNVTVASYTNGQTKAMSGVSNSGSGSVTDATVSQNRANNGAYYEAATNYGLVSYTVSDGKYALTNNVGVNFTVGDGSTGGKIGKGQVYMGQESGGKVVYANADTKFVVRTLDAAGNKVYTAYNGVNELPTMSNVTAGVHVTAANAPYASVIYLIADSAIYAGSTVYAYVTSTTFKYVEYGDITTYTVYIDGVATDVIYVKNDTGTKDSTQHLFTEGTGLYALHFLTGDAKVSSATKVPFDGSMSWKKNTIAAGTQGDGAIVITTSSGVGLNVSAAKIYTYDAETGAISVGKTDDLAAGVNVAYKLVAGSDYMVDTIYVGVPEANS